MGEKPAEKVNWRGERRGEREKEERKRRKERKKEMKNLEGSEESLKQLMVGDL